MTHVVQYGVALLAASAALIVVIANRPDKRPGNLAPIQLITSLGAWSLIVVNAVIVGVACAAGSLPIAIAPIGTIASAVILFASGAATPHRSLTVPESVTLVIAEIRSFLSGAGRVGLNEIDAALVRSGPRIGVAVPARGRMVVLLHESFVAWMERHGRGTGVNAATIASFVRFAVLHELGHVLNGDHRTYRLARSVLIAHLWWFLSAFTIPLTLASGDAFHARTIASSTLFMALLVTTQAMIARRFIAERERLADWRAIQSLSVDDATRLLRRRGLGRGRKQSPTEIEKLMIDLRAGAEQETRRAPFGAVVRLLWPPGDSIHQRAEALAGDRAGAPARPVRWAALSGLQCGVLAGAVVLGLLLTFAPVQEQATSRMVMIVVAWFGGAAGTYCVLRTDPARMTVRNAVKARHRVMTGAVFVQTFLLAIVATDQLARALAINGWSPAAAYAGALMLTPGIIILCTWFDELLRDPGDARDHSLLPRNRQAFAVPIVSTFIAILLPVNMAVTYWLGLGHVLKGSWVAVMLCSVAVYLLSTFMARSTNGVLRTAAPVAVLQTPAPVHGFRLYWWNFYIDVTRCSVARAATVVVAFQTAALLPVVAAFAFFMSRLERSAGFESAFRFFFIAALVLLSPVVLIPDRAGRLKVEFLSLIDRRGLELFLLLIEGARHADAVTGERLRKALALWLPSGAPVMAFLLPTRREMLALPALLAFIRVARAAGAQEVVDRTRGQIEIALRDVISDDAVSTASGQPPSLFYSTVAAAAVAEAGLATRFPFERMLDRVGALLVEELSARRTMRSLDIVAAAQLLQAHQRPIPDPEVIRPFVRQTTLMSKAVRYQSLVELCDLAELLNDPGERERLAPIVRSRLWEILHLNPRKDVHALVDSYLAAVRLGEQYSPLVSADGVVIAEIAGRTADEMEVAVKQTAA